MHQISKCAVESFSLPIAHWVVGSSKGLADTNSNSAINLFSKLAPLCILCRKPYIQKTDSTASEPQL